MSYKDKETLHKLYVKEDLTMSEVGERLNCSANTVSVWANKFGINTGKLTDEERSKISLSEKQHSILKGTLMGDGNIGNTEQSIPNYRITMKNEEFIRWLGEELKPLTSSIKKRKGEYAETLDNPQYTVNTYSHNLLEEYEDWYSSGEKRWPLKETFTPLELKMLYVTDGSPVKHPDNWAAKISAINECDRKEKVSEMFSRELDIDISWHSSDKDRHGVIYISSDDSDIIFNQTPPPGFEYKWPPDKR